VATCRQAFTLFELVLVSAVLALLVAIAWPNLEPFQADARVVAAADMVKGRLAEARYRAVDEGRPYRFEIIDNTRCRVVPDTGDAPAPGSAPAGPADENGEGTPGEDTLPRSVTFDLSHSDTTGADDYQAGGGGGFKVVFLPDGSAREDAEIRISSQGARGAMVQLRALTATITVVRTEGNGS
jgi:prepilin-type N-terminal cleavage/methylation domain-containing protein